MLRPLASQNQPFVCWNCVLRLKNGARRRPGSSSRSKHSAGAKVTVPRRLLSVSHRNQATVEGLSVPIRYGPPPLPEVRSIDPNTKIRKHLREWEALNEESFVPERDVNQVQLQSTDIYNHSEFSSGDGIHFESAEDIRDLATQDDFGSVAAERNFLRPGDLVELHANGRRDQRLAIYIGECGHQYQFYSITGGWLHRTQHAVSIFFPGFVRPEELDAIRPYLPKEAVPAEQENKLQQAGRSVSQEIGKPLLLKMNDFLIEANAAFKKAADNLEGAYSKLAQVATTYHATLPEIASVLFEGVFARKADGKFSPAVLYALHRFLIGQEELFRPSDVTIRAETQYEIRPTMTILSVQRVVNRVREYRAAHITGNQPVDMSFSLFIRKARRLIGASRRQRQFTPYGSLGPKLNAETYAHARNSVQHETFTKADTDFIAFMELWVGLKSFPSSSYLNGIGSVILRAIDRYGMEDIDLGPRTAWTFLKEIGAISPWKTAAEYRLGLAEVQSRVGLPKLQMCSDFVEDKVKDIRKDCSNQTVFCVDDTYAHEIDDGMSLEAAESPNEYWVHIHIADPTSYLDPESKTMKRAQGLVETLYLPNTNIPLLDPKFAMENLSLRPGSPSLTFSAKMDLAGHVLDTKVGPGMLSDVVFMTPATFAEVGVEKVAQLSHTYVVGHDGDQALIPRPMVDKSQLSESQRQDIRILHKIAQARLVKQGKKGISLNTLAPSISASIPSAASNATNRQRKSNVEYSSDPTMKLNVPASNGGKEGKANSVATDLNAVACFMQIAGQIASTWCSERGIPIPYRVSARNPDKQDPAVFFAQTMLPTIEKEGQPTRDQFLQYFRLIGSVQLSTTPGRHLGLGLPMYTRATSPLRRYLDLVVHFQIHAALQEERRTSQSLRGNTRDDFLPFSKVALDKILSDTFRAEKRIQQYSRRVQAEWVLQFLLRTWKFSDAGLASPLIFNVSRVNPTHNSIQGSLVQYMIPAQMDLPQGALIEDINVGDRFEVEIRDMDIPDQRLFLRAVRSIPSDDVPSAT